VSVGRNDIDYDQAALDRWVPEPAKRAERTAFQRDRARVLHSAALRRLAAKTQVHATFDDDFPRTRLTHSLEVAQIGRELGAALGCDPDIVDAAALAHDIGHPPFGHNGEAALDEATESCGGFEGNAQTLRILTRLEAKVVREDDTSAGLNLTRATLDASCKYPWERRAGQRKFGVYVEDRAVFGWIRQARPDERRCIEAQVMDWADDIAYSVHDLEDGIHAGLVDLSWLDDVGERRALFEVVRTRYVPADDDEIETAYSRLRELACWPRGYDGSFGALASLKQATSELIGRFCSAAEDETRAAFGGGRLIRYGADLVVPRESRIECALLKAVTARFVMDSDESTARYAVERELITELVVAVTAGAPGTLERPFAAAYEAASDDAGALRAIIDQVASLTDPSAVAMHSRLVRQPGGR
jgi:dGTPase